MDKTQNYSSELPVDALFISLDEDREKINSRISRLISKYPGLAGNEDIDISVYTAPTSKMIKLMEQFKMPLTNLSTRKNELTAVIVRSEPKPFFLRRRKWFGLKSDGFEDNVHIRDLVTDSLGKSSYVKFKPKSPNLVDYHIHTVD